MTARATTGQEGIAKAAPTPAPGRPGLRQRHDLAQGGIPGRPGRDRRFWGHLRGLAGIMAAWMRRRPGRLDGET